MVKKKKRGETEMERKKGKVLERHIIYIYKNKDKINKKSKKKKRNFCPWIGLAGSRTQHVEI